MSERIKQMKKHDKEVKCIRQTIYKDTCTIILGKGKPVHGQTFIDEDIIMHYDKNDKLVQIERIGKNIPCIKNG